MELSRDQKDALELFIEWRKGNYNPNKDDIFVLAGAAGTGKSFILKQMTDTAGLTNTITCTFTGKASLVLNQRGTPAITIHKLIYNLIEDEKTGIVSFEKKVKLDVDYDLIIIDEVSMVAEQIKKDLLSFKIPILACGDDAQLQPVDGTNNGLLEHPDAELTTVHRQALNNPIIALATMIREQQITKQITDCQLKDPSGRVRVWVGKLRNLPTDEYHKILTNSKQILVATNKQRNAVNDLCRQINGVDIERNIFPLKGEKIICRKNSWSTTLSNAEIQNKLIFKNSLFDGIDVVTKKTDYNFFEGSGVNDIKDLKFFGLPLINGMIGNALNDVAIKHDSDAIRFMKAFDKKKATKKRQHTALLDFKPDFATDLEYFEGLPLDIDYFLTGQYLKERDDRYFQETATDEFYGQFCFQFGYAITVHSSQGSQFPNVTIMDPVYNPAGDDYYKWLYTAVTRAEKTVLILKT